MIKLFKTITQNITLHFKNILGKVELQDNSTCKNFLRVQKKRRIVMGYIDKLLEGVEVEWKRLGEVFDMKNG